MLQDEAGFLSQITYINNDIGRQTDKSTASGVASNSVHNFRRLSVFRRFEILTKSRKCFCSGIRMMTLMTFILGLVSCSAGPKGAPDNGSASILAENDLQLLLDSTQNSYTARSSSVTHILEHTQVRPSSDAWPIDAFLVAEARRARGENQEAEAIYRQIVEWAAANPYQDGWGGSSLSYVALCRWLDLLDEKRMSADKVVAIIGFHDKLRRSRFAMRMYQPAFLNALPAVEEELTRKAARSAWYTGIKDQALRLFLDYLSIARSADLNPDEAQIMNELVASGIATPDHLILFRGKRLLALGNYDDAFRLLTEASNSQVIDVRTQARLNLAKVRKILYPRQDKEVYDLLTSVKDEAINPEIVESALLSLGDFSGLVERYPGSPRVPQAWYGIGVNAYYAGDLDAALEAFDKVRQIPEPNNYRNRAAFFAAIVLYTRGTPIDLNRASALLQEIIGRPVDEVRPGALFWLGRIKEESGDSAQAGSLFQQIIEERPYEYYAIRARMHLKTGSQAAKSLCLDEQVWKELNQAFRNSEIESTIVPSSPYHRRLNYSLDIGLYRQVADSEARLRSIFPSKRVEDLSFKELDDSGLLTQFALLIALRQDASAAKDKDSGAENKLRIAAAVGYRGNDWPMLLNLAWGSGELYDRVATAQQNSRYLATAYPHMHKPVFQEASLRSGVAAELLYATVMEESAFESAALSRAGALGLFQFIPTTFDDLNSNGNLLRTAGVKTREAFLLDPRLNIELGAQWLQNHLGKSPHDNTRILFGLLKHNAGTGNTRKWTVRWAGVGRTNDIEYMIEVVPDSEKRRFLRRTLTDLVLVDAGGILKDNQGNQGTPLSPCDMCNQLSSGRR